MAQDDIQRLHSSDFQAPNTINASEVNAELDQLVTYMNTKASRVVAESILSTWHFTKGLRLGAKLEPYSIGNIWFEDNQFKGYTTDGVVSLGTAQTDLGELDDRVTATEAAVTENDKYQNMIERVVSDQGLTFNANTVTQLSDAVTLATYAPVLAKLYRPLPYPVYVSGTSFSMTFDTPLARFNRTTGKLITIPSATYTVNLATNNALNRLDTGTFTIGTTYHLYLAQVQGSATSGLFVSSGTHTNQRTINAIVHDVYRLPFSFVAVNDGSENAVLLPFSVDEFDDRRMRLRYQVSYPSALSATTKYHDVTTNAPFVQTATIVFVPTGVLDIDIAVIATSTNYVTFREDVTGGRELESGEFFGFDVVEHIRLNSSRRHSAHLNGSPNAAALCVYGYTILI